MKLLFLSSYFKPDKISSAHFGEDLRQALAARGHTMELYAPTPTRGVSDEVRQEYKKNRKDEYELDGKLHIHRFSLFREKRNPLLRALRYGVLEVQLLWFGLRAKNIDLLPMSSTPPINGLMATLLKKWKKIPYVYIVQDMFPESLVSTGMTKRGSLLWKIGNWVSNVTYRNAAHIMVISDSMKQTLIEKGIPADKITVSYNWIDIEKTIPVPREENPLFEEFGLDREKFYLTYAGNLGNSQNAGLLVDCAEKLKDYKAIQFVIFGSGTEKGKLEKRITESGLTNIQMLPLQPMEKVSQVYSLGDASFVICKKGVGEGAFPSKAVSIMATGTPILASFDMDSDLCRIVEEKRIGLCADAGDVDGAVAAILQLYENRTLCKTMGENARELACSRFSKETGTALRIDIYEKYEKLAQKSKTHAL